MSQWAKYGTCTVSCGEGSQTRSRSINVNATDGGAGCGSLEDSRACYKGLCPIHCDVSSWSGWSLCSKTCGRGTKSRSRSVITHPLRKGDECGALSDTDECAINPCAVDCQMGQWGGWEACTASCYDSSTQSAPTRTRTRKTLLAAAWGGEACPSEDHVMTCKAAACPECNLSDCPVDCVVEGWGGWHPFVGGGTTLKRERSVETHPSGGGKACPDLSQLDEHLQDSWKAKCDTKEETNTYYGWSVCSKACGTGYQYQYRQKTVCSDVAALKYHMNFRQGRHCNTQSCTSASAQPMQLAEELVPSGWVPTSVKETGGVWRTLSVAELAKHGLPRGHWQKYE
eukprot:g4376.t1